MPCFTFRKNNILHEKLQNRCKNSNVLRKNNPKDFTILEKIDEGYSGIVYSGYYNKKLIAAKLNKTEREAVRIQYEYNLIQKLRKCVYNKSFIINVHKMLTHHDKSYMIMDLCIMDLFTFSQKLILDEDRTELTLAPVIRQMMESVYVCHDVMCTHGDIKLENFMITQKFSIVLCDFGFACQHRSYSVFNDKYMGSLSYISPQMCALKHKEKAYYNPYKHDLWGLGISIFAILFNTFPFLSPELQCTEYKIYETIPIWSNLTAFVHPRKKNVSHGMKSVLLTLLSPLESQRYILKNMF